MKFGFIGFWPLHLVLLFILFPSHTLSFLFLFFHVFMASCFVVSSFFSFAHALVRSLVRTRAGTRNPGLRSPRLFLGGLARLVVPGHLAPFYRRIAATYTYTLSVLSSCHVLIRLSSCARVRMHIV